MARSVVRGSVWCSGPIRATKFHGKKWLWHFMVTVDDRCVLYDNTGSYRKIFDTCIAGVETISRLVGSGRAVETYTGYVQYPPRFYRRVEVSSENSKHQA